MNMTDKDEQMKKHILANNIFIAVQITFVVLSIIFNFIADDSTVFITVFVHIALFVLYNIFVENIVIYGYLSKKYEKIWVKMPAIRHFKVWKQIYKASKNKSDTISTTLISQSVVKTVIVIVNMVLLILTVSFE